MTYIFTTLTPAMVSQGKDNQTICFKYVVYANLYRNKVVVKKNLLQRNSLKQLKAATSPPRPPHPGFDNFTPDVQFN